MRIEYPRTLSWRYGIAIKEVWSYYTGNDCYKLKAFRNGVLVVKTEVPIKEAPEEVNNYTKEKIVSEIDGLKEDYDKLIKEAEKFS